MAHEKNDSQRSSNYQSLEEAKEILARIVKHPRAERPSPILEEYMAALKKKQEQKK